jgi:8-oxo-dGTP diphosphatase
MGVARVLSQLVQTARAEGAQDGDVLITSTQAELARMAGSSRESASRFLALLERVGIISQGRGSLPFMILRRSSGMSTSRRGKDFSAGGVVVRDDDVVVIVPARRGREGNKVLGLPKGHLDGDETEVEAAIREVREETGVDAEPIEKLGEIRYTYERRGRPIDKRVAFYLLEYRSGELRHDHEIEQVQWMPLEEAARSLTYEGEREMVARALSRRASDL